MADVKWIKIVTDIFDDEKILLIETLPEADSIIVIWFKLLCLAGKQNNSGVFMMNNTIPYTEKMLATIFRRKETTVNLALKTFENFGMIEIINGAITIPNWGKHQSIEKIERNKEYQRNYQRMYYHKQKAIAENKNSKCLDKPLDKDLYKYSDKSNLNIADKNREKEDIDKNKNKEEESRDKEEKPILALGKYNNVYLSDFELDNLKKYYPEMYLSKIERLSEFMITSCKTYNNHYTLLLKWLEEDKDIDMKNKNSKKSKKYIAKDVDLTHDDEYFRDLEKKLGL